MTHETQETQSPIAVAIDRVLAVLSRAPLDSSTDLKVLFEKLQKTGSAEEARDCEQQIWATWSRHSDSSAVRGLEAATTLMAKEEWDRADDQLSQLIEDWPDWAEVWNKRATLRFIEERDEESLADIAETLQRESRHFGAVAGFAQICLRAEDTGSARVALQFALSINPHMPELRRALKSLVRITPDLLH